MRAMSGSDFCSKILFTGVGNSPQPELDTLGISYDFLDVPTQRKRKDEWRALKHYLDEAAPCIYFTNFDFHRSCAIGTLSKSVFVVIVVHSDEECYFDELRRVGKSCNAVVCVSSFLAAKVRKRFPHLRDKTHFIPYGIPIENYPESRREHGGKLRLCYCNRLQQYQKRVFDLPLVAKELEQLGVDFEMDIAGDGADASELRDRFDNADLNATVRFYGRLSNAEVMDVYRRSHLFLLTSDFEGLPISLLEAMSVGCVPVVYRIDSGIGDAVASPEFGLQIPHGDFRNMAKAIKTLDENRTHVMSLSNNCMERSRKYFDIKQMAKSYEKLFINLCQKKDDNNVIRDSKITVPEDLTMRHRLMRRIRGLTTR